MELLKVENLCKTYGTGEARVEALKKVSFSMQRGEFAAVVGASGSGKSTLLNCIGGLDNADGGKVLLGGRDLFAMEDTERTVFRRQNIGFIFQSFHLIPELNVEQNIIFPVGETFMAFISIRDDAAAVTSSNMERITPRVLEKLTVSIFFSFPLRCPALFARDLPGKAVAHFARQPGSQFPVIFPGHGHGVGVAHRVV